MKWLLLTSASVLVFAATASTDDKKREGPVTLKLIAKTDKYKFVGDVLTPSEAELGEVSRLMAASIPVLPPQPLKVDLLLQLTNTSNEAVTLYVEGDMNEITFDLTGGDGVGEWRYRGPFTADLRLPKPVTLAPGKSYELPVKQLTDGLRGMGRWLWWTGPGEYTLTAKYRLSDNDGGSGTILQSQPVKITVEQ